MGEKMLYRRLLETSLEAVGDDSSRGHDVNNIYNESSTVTTLPSTNRPSTEKSIFDNLAIGKLTNEEIKETILDIDGVVDDFLESLQVGLYWIMVCCYSIEDSKEIGFLSR